MPATKAQPPETPAPEQPARVFGLMGQEFTLAGKPFHFARFTTAGMRTIINLIGNGALPTMYADGATTGEMVAEAVVLGQESAATMFERFLEHVVHEPIPDGICNDAETTEIASCVDAFFGQSGFRLMDATIKNFAAREAKKLQAQLMVALEERETPSEQQPTEPPTTEPDSTSLTS